jgi:ABC-type glycerol-3-phosphate transport system substrate-binding protein
MNRMRIGLVGILLIAVVVAAVLVGRGLGSSDNATSDQAAVRQVMTDLQTASRDGDGERICNQIFTPKLSNAITRSSTSGSCAAEVKAKLFSPATTIKVENVDVPDESNATVTVKEANGNTSTVFLVKQSGRWRIRSVTPA